MAPALVRWFSRSRVTQNVYSNSQNVHDHSIQSTTNSSVINFVSNHELSCGSGVDKLIELIELVELSDQTKLTLKSYSSDNCIHSVIKMTYEEVLLYVMDYISTHDDKKDLLVILEDEVKASNGVCFQGKLSRLIGVISGYHPLVNIIISDNEQIGNVVVAIKKRLGVVGIDEFVGVFRAELVERNYSVDVIDEWVGYIRESY